MTTMFQSLPGLVAMALVSTVFNHATIARLVTSDAGLGAIAMLVGIAAIKLCTRGQSR